MGTQAHQLVESLANRGLEDTALVIVKGIAGLPENIVSGLYSEDPKVRGSTGQCLADWGSCYDLRGKLGIKVLDNVGTGSLPGSLEAQRGGVKVPSGDRSLGANGGTGSAVVADAAGG